MAFRWLFVALNNDSSTNGYGHFELFRFLGQKITLVAGLGLKQACLGPEGAAGSRIAEFLASDFQIRRQTHR
jgi:hypothetical protein